MSLPKDCLWDLVKRLQPNEVSVLDALEGRLAVTGLNRDEIIRKVAETDQIQLSHFQMRIIVARLELAGFIDSNRAGLTHLYYLTPSGQEALAILQHQ